MGKICASPREKAIPKRPWRTVFADGLLGQGAGRTLCSGGLWLSAKTSWTVDAKTSRTLI